MLTAVTASSPRVQGHDATLTAGTEYTVKFLNAASAPHGNALVDHGMIAFLMEPCLSWVHACRIFIHNITTDETWDTGNMGTLQDLQYPYLMFEHDEYTLGELNGDGRNESLLATYNVVTRSSQVVAGNIWGSASLSDGRIAYNRIEIYDQKDYNLDGDLYDQAVFLYDISERSETLAGMGIYPWLAGRYLAWLCRDVTLDLCSMDTETRKVVAAGLPWLYPDMNIGFRNGDEDVLALSVHDDGDFDGNGVKGEYFLASFNLATGAFEIHLDAGAIAFWYLSTSEGKVLAYHSGTSDDSRHPYGYFVHNLNTGETVELPNDLRLQHPIFHADSVVANFNVTCVTPPEFDCHPRLDAKVILYDISRGEMRDLSACCIVRAWSGAYDGDTVVLVHNEHVLGTDFNGDGDLQDEFIGYATTLLNERKPHLTNETRNHPSVVRVYLELPYSAVAVGFGLTVFVLIACSRKREFAQDVS